MNNYIGTIEKNITQVSIELCVNIVYRFINKNAR